MSAARSARRPVPALVFLLALAVLAVVVWVRVADRDSSANSAGTGCASAPQLPANAAVTVTVLNGAGKDGLASGTLEAFVAKGFGRGNYDNAETLPGVATVTSGPNNTGGALLVSFYLPGSTVTTDDRGDNSVTVTLGQKYTGLASPTKVAAAMAAAMVSQTPAAPASGTATTGASSAKPAPTATCTTTPPVPSPSASAPASPAAS